MKTVEDELRLYYAGIFDDLEAEQRLLDLIGSDRPARPPWRRPEVRRWPAVIGSVVAVAITATVLASVTTSGSSSAPPVRTGSSAPVAGSSKQPLLGYLPPPTAPIQLATGSAAGSDWTLWAQLTPVTGVPVHTSRLNGVPVSLVSGVGLSTAISINRHSTGLGGFSGPVGDPRKLPQIVLGAGGPGAGFNAKLIVGVTSVPATMIRIQLSAATAPLVTKTITTSELPGLYFFVAQVPLGHIASISGLNDNGTTLLEADPADLPQGP